MTPIPAEKEFVSSQRSFSDDIKSYLTVVISLMTCNIKTLLINKESYVFMFII